MNAFASVFVPSIDTVVFAGRDTLEASICSTRYRVHAMGHVISYSVSRERYVLKQIVVDVNRT
jgi:hypothetical protein